MLGLGNLLLHDDGVGLEVLKALEADRARWGDRVELMDGGTLGLSLLGEMSGRPAIVCLDAAGLDASPGTVRELTLDQALRLAGGGGGTAHEGGAIALLATARLTGDLPARGAVIGVVPALVRTGIGLTGVVRDAVPTAAARARAAVDRLLAGAETGKGPVS